MVATVTDQEFNRIYAGLNTAQKKAVDTIEGPVMVIAGPGTGKTTILTLRIANILRKTDTAPSSILALTFTESGAYAMRKKLVSIIGPAGYKVNIKTFHGFCNDIIGQFPEKFPKIISSKAVSDIEQMKVMEEIITKLPLKMLKPYGDVFHYVKPALNEIRNLKKENISAEDFRLTIKKQLSDLESAPDLYHEKGAYKGKMKGEYVKLAERIKKNEELAVVYEEYEKMLAEKRYYDFEDMIVEVIRSMEADADFLLVLQESYQYLLADEHQDANNSQNTILELLSGFHESPNLFIVGDEKQAIFRFQGASLENFLYFKKIYPDAVLINLEENYRSHQSILDLSHSLISYNASPEGHERIKLTSKKVGKKESGLSVCLAEFSKPTYECEYVAFRIKELIDGGLPSEEIAVLYRENKDAFAISYALKRQGIQYRIESDQNILKDEHIRKLLLILRAVNDLTDNNALGKILFINFIGIGTVEAYKLLNAAFTGKKNLFDVIQSEDEIKKAGIADPKPIIRISKLLLEWATCSKNKPFIECFEIIVRQSGFIDDALSNENSLDQLATLEAFFGEVKKLAGTYKEFYLADFMAWMNLVEEHGILVKGGGKLAHEGVRLMTAHRSKGLEFERVFVIGLNDGHWGNKTHRVKFHIPILGKSVQQDADIEDERRLFYVALTRAKDAVFLTYSLQNNEGKEILPSQFVSELDQKLVTRVDVSKFEEKYKSEPQKLFDEHAPSKVPAVDKTYIHDLFLDRGLSATALNHYLECPWKYFFENLVRLPQVKNKHQMYGTAIHDALKTFFSKYKEEQDMTAEELIRLFEFNLAKLPLTREDYESSLEKGRLALGGWYETYKGSWPRNIFTEYSVSGVSIPMEESEEGIVHNLLLRGQLDKIEIVDGVVVNVVDYKTKQPMSRGEIEGTTKSSNGDYKRQLVFYKLLLMLDEKRKFVMKTGELDFIEPDDKGRYKREKFEIIDENIQELTDCLRKTAKEILELQFWDKECNEKDCEYCRLSKLLKKE